MFEQYDFLSKINQISENKLSKEKKISNNFSTDELISPIKNFYMTDSVSRNSPVMSECSQKFNLK